MASPVFTEATLEISAGLPLAKRGAGFRTVLVSSYTRSALTPDETVEVPLHLNSREFLLFAHFDEEAADKIWQTWCDKDPSTRGQLIDHVRLHIKEVAKSHNAIKEEDDWDGALKELGWCKEWRDGTLLPKHRDLRLCQSAGAWVASTLEQSFFFVATLSSRMLQMQEGIRRGDPRFTTKPGP